MKPQQARFLFPNRTWPTQMLLSGCSLVKLGRLTSLSKHRMKCGSHPKLGKTSHRKFASADENVGRQSRPVEFCLGSVTTLSVLSGLMLRPDLRPIRSIPEWNFFAVFAASNARMNDGETELVGA